ncbi:helix-turn-helix domain-containing protein [Tenacibaculum piscium]|uniref:helix-turn-helix domain-containing protein n=1 Tax=Tenacibaculum piscium TaxID=1458515 RepID=UPI00187B8AA3|nr:AraC family transcriptional regulator [Tenacibaculum piscium]MBE7684868.1 helix-turn-helix domain-containing protein [Tenacibaculum piscium]MBE7689571.1 helix-turn-helix domain-containing protein [Tenacibaculum piscium]
MKNQKNYENLQDTLSFFNIDCHNSYYISSGKSIFKFPENPFRMDYYAFCICTDGEIDLEINAINYKIRKGSVFCSAPSTIVHFLNASPNFKIQTVFFEKNFLLTNISDPFIIEKMALFQQSSYSVLHTSEENTRNLLKIINTIKEKEQCKSIFTKQMIRVLIFNLLLEIAEIIQQKTPNIIACKDVKTTIYLRFNKLVQECILEEKSVGFYASELCISNKYLIEITKKNVGKTPHQIIEEALLKEALVLLGNPALSISEIAYQLQFNSISAFGRFFKRQTTSSPSSYRNTKK